MAERDNVETREDPFCEVILIAGFLGSGKTTLLCNILKWPGDLSKTAILVNEFGKIGIDGEILQGFKTPVFELTNGCICCSIQGDFVGAVQEIMDEYRPTRLFIEATGVADPFDVLGFLNTPQFEKHFAAPKIVTVLNGDLWEGREYFGPLFYNQIKAAELLLLNKVDLLPKEDVPQFLQEIREINPSASVVPTLYCRIDPEALWKPVIDGDETKSFYPHRHEDLGSAEEMGYVAFAFEHKSPFKADRFYRFIEDLPIKLYRVKGFALLEGKRFFMNHVGGKTEWIEVDEEGPTRLALVGWQVNEDEILEALKACLDHSRILPDETN